MIKNKDIYKKRIAKLIHQIIYSNKSAKLIPSQFQHFTIFLPIL